MSKEKQYALFIQTTVLLMTIFYFQNTDLSLLIIFFTNKKIRNWFSQFLMFKGLIGFVLVRFEVDTCHSKYPLGQLTHHDDPVQSLFLCEGRRSCQHS